MVEAGGRRGEETEATAGVRYGRPAAFLLMGAKQWARVKRTGTHGLRRGAWYPVVSDLSSGLIIVDVRRHNIPVLRAHVDVRDDAPSLWSVVQWDEQQRGAKRAGELNRGLTYAVCPACSERSKVEPQAQRLKCHDCGGEFAVDWGQPC